MTRVSQTGQEILNDRVGTRKGYTGHLNDTAADLVYMKARYYDPQIGRFYSNDPVGFVESRADTFNRYRYVGGNPYSRIDPDGREWVYDNPVDQLYYEAAMAVLSRINLELKQIIDTIAEDKSRKHKLRHRVGVKEGVGSLPEDGISDKEYTERLKNGIPVNTLTTIDMGNDTLSPSGLELSPWSKFAHELMHIWDAHTGNYDGSKSDKGDWTKNEDKAVEAGDSVREFEGEPLRETYDQ